jgi:hypothetical protein
MPWVRGRMKCTLQEIENLTHVLCTALNWGNQPFRSLNWNDNSGGGGLKPVHFSFSEF